jgi:hypothetical protein
MSPKVPHAESVGRWHPVGVLETMQTVGALLIRWQARRRTAGPGLVAMIQALRYDAATARAMGGATADFYMEPSRQQRSQAIEFEAKALANTDAAGKILAAVRAWDHDAFAAAGPAGQQQEAHLVERQLTALDKVDAMCREALDLLAKAERGAR